MLLGTAAEKQARQYDDNRVFHKSAAAQRPKLNHHRLATSTATAERPAPTTVCSSELLGHGFISFYPSSLFYLSVQVRSATDLAGEISSQLSTEERHELAAMRRQSLQMSEMADHLGHHRSTLHREVKRNQSAHDGCYRGEPLGRESEWTAGAIPPELAVWAGGVCAH